MLSNAHPHVFTSTVSHTTRQRRVGEVEGESYLFVSPSEFSALLSRDAFVEHAWFSGQQYGTSKKTIAEQAAKGLIVILDIEMDGVKKLKADPEINARYVFIGPPSFEVLETRLKGRGTDREEDVERRLTQARIEMEFAKVPRVHDKIIINNDLDVAFIELEEFVLPSRHSAKIAIQG